MKNKVDENSSIKVSWHGKIESVQPRTRVWRYKIDNRTHFCLGYNLFIQGKSSDGRQQFVVAISEKQQMKYQFRIGDTIEGTAWTKKYPKREYADFYKAGSLKLLERPQKDLELKSPPWITVLPALKVYEERGARILSKSTWRTKCFTCIWANMANIEIQWDFDKNIKRYRFETFCYGPKSCKFYKMGKPPAVPYKNSCTVFDDGSLDEILTEGRDYDE